MKRLWPLLEALVILGLLAMNGWKDRLIDRQRELLQQAIATCPQDHPGSAAVWVASTEERRRP